MKISKKKYWKEIGKVLEDKSNDYAKSLEEHFYFIDSGWFFFRGIGRTPIRTFTAPEFYKKWIKLQKKTTSPKQLRL